MTKRDLFLYICVGFIHKSVKIHYVYINYVLILIKLEKHVSIVRNILHYLALDIYNYIYFIVLIKIKQRKRGVYVYISD